MTPMKAIVPIKRILIDKLLNIFPSQTIIVKAALLKSGRYFFYQSHFRRRHQFVDVQQNQHALFYRPQPDQKVSIH
ncbi:hypothetical protein D3C79_1095440 [compost metagenome]